jgi:aflatoxin B1 aldehyde reductase
MPPSILFGCASIGPKFTNLDSVQSLLSTLKSLNITHLDTAARYGGGISETLLGEADASAKDFMLDSKILTLQNGEPELTKEKIEASTLTTLQRLKVQKLHTLYIHAPDPLTPLFETAQAMDAQFRAGRMEELGLSNFSAELVEEYIAVCREHGYVLPSVYQGQYNLLNREAETTLFPLLRREGIGFLAYSPLASGFLTAKEEKKGNPIVGRLLGDLKVVEAVERFKITLEGFGMEATEAALRWVVFHSGLGEGDAVTLGGSRESQVEDSVGIIERGPLDERVVMAVEKVWEDVKDR